MADKRKIALLDSFEIHLNVLCTILICNTSTTVRHWKDSKEFHDSVDRPHTVHKANETREHQIIKDINNSSSL